MTFNRKATTKFWKATGLDDKAARKAMKAACPKGHHVDHIMPLALGGPDLAFNLQILPKRYNTSKGAEYTRLDQEAFAEAWAALTPEYQAKVRQAMDVLAGKTTVTETVTTTTVTTTTTTHRLNAQQLADYRAELDAAFAWWSQANTWKSPNPPSCRAKSYMLKAYRKQHS